MDGSEVHGEGGQAARPDKRTRRQWTAKDKRRIVREAQRPGAVRQEVAQRHGIHVSLLTRWRAEQMSKASGGKKPASTVRLLPVQVRKSRPSRGATAPIPAVIAGTEVGTMEVGFPTGRRLTVRGVVDGRLLRTMIEELSRC